jgi:hypothetical protein
MPECLPESCHTNGAGVHHPTISGQHQTVKSLPELSGGRQYAYIPVLQFFRAERSADMEVIAINVFVAERATLADSSPE